MSLKTLEIKEKPAWLEWASKNVRPIGLHSDRDTDLDFLEDYVGDKRIVLLGENGHGIAEHNEIRIRLIRYLHERMGFNVVVFESGLADCGLAGMEPGGSPADIMRKSIFKVWRSEELIPLFEQIVHSGDQKSLILAGMDPQPSSEHGLLPQVVSSVLTELDRGFVERFEHTEKDLLTCYSEIQRQLHLGGANSKAVKRDFKARKSEFIEIYQQGLALLETHEQILIRNAGNEMYHLVHRSMYNRIYFIKMLSGSSRQYIRRRDRCMADNLVWLAEVLYPEHKFIVWGHNGHISKNMKSWFGFISMGSLLPERLRGQTYTIGQYMRGGTAASNTREVYEITEAPEGSVESIVGNLGHRCAFLDLSRHQIKNKGNEWIYNYCINLDWGRSPYYIRLKEQYDAVIVVNNVRPPKYLE